MMMAVHNDVKSRSSFAVNKGADVLNKINQGCRHSIVGNLLGGPGSCGARDERQFFTGDAALAAEASLLHYDVPAVYLHWLQTVVDQQRPNGAIGDYGPDTIGDTRDGHANWGTGFPTVAFMLWHHYGDIGVIARHLPQLHQYMDFLEMEYNKTSSSGLRKFWPSCICGWITLGATPLNSLMSSFGYLNGLRMMADMTEAVGDGSSTVYRRRFIERRVEFHDAFFNAANSSYGVGTQDEHALALWIGAPPTAELAGAVATTLVAQIEEMIAKAENATSPTTKPKGVDFVGGVGVRFLFEALARNGHAATALKLAMKTTWPGYGYMFYNELEPSTTLWELWGGDDGAASMDSRNHIYSASISTFFYKHISGIDASRAGFDHINIAPISLEDGTEGADSLWAAEAQVGTPHGPVVSSWTTHTASPTPPPGPNMPCGANSYSACDMKEEGDAGPESAHLCIGCPGEGNISAVTFASFGSAAPDAGLGSCLTGLHTGMCAGGSPRLPCHNCANCPPCTNGSSWPNATAVVEKMCMGKPKCPIPVDFEKFGDTCNGKKTLAVRVECSGGRDNASMVLLTSLTSVYQHTVVLPVGVAASVVIPLRGHDAAAVTITESAQPLWNKGEFVSGIAGISGGAMNKPQGGVQFEVVQGSYVFELLVPRGPP
jgi:hypothetical protein